MMDELDDLNGIDLSSNENDGMLFSNVYKVLEGGFERNGIETYLSSVKVGWLAKDIEIFEKLTEDKSWPVSSIIQREIDDRRVKQIAEEYILKSTNNVKYFPPIIVAIVPREPNEHISKFFSILSEQDISSNEIIFSKSDFPTALKERFLDAENKSRVDGLYVLDWLNSQGKLALSWDKAKIYGIVIDGQHRLEALKYALQKKQDVANYLQDVVFLDVSKKANKENRSPAEALRRIFIDINYNAKPVSNARRTLMDDKDLSSLIVQSLVNDDDMNGERLNKYLVPQIVDWHSENLKHSYPQITGVLVLQQLIEDNFLNGVNITSLSDMRTRNRVTRFVEILNTKFLVDEKILSKEKYSGIGKLEESYNEFKDKIDKAPNGGGAPDDKEDILFTMDYNVLNVARDTFEELYSTSIVKLFNEFSPYKRAVAILDKNKVFDNEYNLNRLVIKNPSKLSDEQREQLEKLQTEMKVELDPKFYLIFTVLGQKAFFKHYYKELTRYLQSKTVTETEVLTFTKLWLDKMNFIVDKLVTSNLFSKDQKFSVPPEIQSKHDVGARGIVAGSFWQGIIYNDQNIIYNRQGVDGFVGVLNFLYNVAHEETLLRNESFTLSTWDAIPYSKARIHRKIKQDNPDLEESEVEKIVSSIWLSKLETIKDLVRNTFFI
ncbi:DGQHR domain-containing protein [Thalassotalea mangrovi]|uniref:DGQHR domain-containing protein n=1 Tax=Thalassotalea mangrovi TaxID=2572245 RepID=A0A4U1B754_9GAMM|nr:DGQHR domain-containing protein [Thalassotalea mangrovi]TKB46331.1 DGQHR domain-containing protein [Thalassotalea mangrovi]